MYVLTARFTPSNKTRNESLHKTLVGNKEGANIEGEKAVSGLLSFTVCFVGLLGFAGREENIIKIIFTMAKGATSAT